MGDLDYKLLAEALTGDLVKSTIAAEDPYAPFMAVPKATSLAASGLAVKDPTSKNLRDGAIIGAVSGLLEGLLGGQSRAYRTEAQGLFDKALLSKSGARPAGLSDSLWQLRNQQIARSVLSNSADIQERKRDLLFDLELESGKSDRSLLNDLTMESVTGKTAKNRARALSLRDSLMGREPTAPALRASPVLASESDVLPDVGSPDLGKRFSELADEAGTEGAGIIIGKEMTAAENVRQESGREIAAGWKALDQTKQTFENLKHAYGQLGDTGGIVGEETLRSAKLGLQEFLPGGEDPAERIAARADFKALALPLVGEIRRLFPGQVTEREMMWYFGGVPGLDKLPEANADIINRMGRTMAAAEHRLTFLDQARRQTIDGRKPTLSEVEGAYARFNMIAPLFKDGKINEDRLNLDPYNLPYEKLLRGEKLTLQKKNDPLATDTEIEGGAASPFDIETVVPPTDDSSILDTVEGAATGYLTGAATFGENALFGLPSRTLAAGSTAIEEGKQLFGLTPDTPIGETFDKSLAGWRDPLAAQQKEYPITSGGAAVAGLFASPVGKLKAVKSLFALKGARGVAGRAGYSALVGGLSTADEEGVEDRVENAALLSVGLDLVAKGTGKAAGLAGDAFKQLTGLGAQAYRTAAKGLSKSDLVAAKEKFNRALKIVDKEHGIPYKTLIGSDETVMQDLASKAHAAIKSRNNTIDNIVKAATKATGGAPVRVGGANVPKMIRQTPGGSQESVTKETADLVKGFYQKVKGKSSLVKIQEEKKLLNGNFKPEKAYKDATTAVAKDFRSTIEREVARLEKLKKLPAGSSEKLKRLNREESDLIVLRNAYASKLPGAMAQSVLSGGASGVSLGKGAMLGGTLGGEEGAKAGIWAALFAHSKRIGRPVSKALSNEDVVNFLASPEARGAGIKIEDFMLGGEDGTPTIGNDLTPTDLGSVELRPENESAFNIFSPSPAYADVPPSKKKDFEMIEAPPDIVEAIRDVAGTVRIDPTLGRAIVEQESAYKPDAVNKKSGATGLGQLLPSTAEWFAKKIDYGDFDIKDPYDNLFISFSYYKYLEEMFDGDVNKALTAYHSGPGNVKRGKIGPKGRKYADQVLKRRSKYTG